jgi:uncharacterized membrane protein YccC
LIALHKTWLADFLLGERQAWIFVFKCLLAFYIAAWLAMLLQLEQPATAMVTVGLVMHPQSGMVRAKGFYRTIGNVAGSLVALLLIAAFPQQPEMFLLALSLWVAGCAGGAMKYRNFMSYGFVLSGYTAAIVALPAISDPTNVFDGAMMRVSEVLLGVIVSGVVSDVVFPDRLSDVLRRSRREHFEQFVVLARDSLQGRTPRSEMERAHLRFVRSAIQIEDLRSSVIFEDPDTRARSRRMQLHNLRYMAAATTLQSLYHLIHRLRRNGHPNTGSALTSLYAPVRNALSAPSSETLTPTVLASQLATCETGLPTLAAGLREALRPDADLRMEFDSGSTLIYRFASELRDLTLLEATLRNTQAPLPGDVEQVHFRRSNDFAAPLVTVLRGFLALAVLSAFWIETSWPSALSALLTASYFCGLLASSSSPVAAAVNVSIGYALGMSGAFVVAFYLLPGSDGFLMLVLASLPFLLIGPYLLTRNATMPGIGTGYVMGFAGILALKNPMVYNPGQFLNDAIASWFGVVACGVAFMLVPTMIGTEWLRRRQLKQLRRQVRFAATSPMTGLLYHAESANRDLLHQIVQYSKPDGEELRSLLTWGLAVHESVRAVIELRQAMAHADLPPQLKDAMQRAVASLAWLYDAPDATRWEEADRAIGAAITLTTQALPLAHASCQPPLAHLLQLRAALRDDESPLAPFIARPSDRQHAT